MTVRAISADSHILEPWGMWAERIDPEFRERAPRVEESPDGSGHLFVCEGRSKGAIRALGTPYAAQKQQTEEGRRGGYDPAARIVDMDMDGIEAEVLYPSMGARVYSIPDGELQAACFRAYNDWLGDFCATNPKRLYGVALIPTFDIEVGVKELRRAAKMGYRAAAVWGTPPDRLPFESGHYDPLWAEAEELEIPISLHAFTGPERSVSNFFLISYTNFVHHIPQTLVTMVFSGVFERFPKLKVLSVENDIGWVPYLIQRMEYGYGRKRGRHGGEFPSGLTPRDIFHRNVRLTFMTDCLGLANLDAMSPDMLMWATDYPHDDSTWPESLRLMEEQFEGIDPAVRDKIVFGNCNELYRMGL